MNTIQLSRNFNGFERRFNSLLDRTKVIGDAHKSGSRHLTRGVIDGDLAIFGTVHNTAKYTRIGSEGPIESLTLSPEAAQHCVWENSVKRCVEFGF